MTDVRIKETSLGKTERWLAMAALGTGVLMGTLDVSIVNVALPILVDEMKTSLEVVQWVIIAYGMVVTSLMLVMGRLGDMFGKKRIFCLGLCIFIIGWSRP